MNIKKVAQSLHAYERKVLPALMRSSLVESLVKETSLKEIEVIRALQWLENKGAVSVSSEPHEKISLDKNGIKYLKEGLPEKRFLKALLKQELPLAKISSSTGLSSEEVNVCVGVLRQKRAILLLQDKQLKVKVTPEGKSLLESKTPEEVFLEKSFPLESSSLSKTDKEILNTLRKRKQIVKLDVETVRHAKLTTLGKELIELGVKDEDVVDAVTPQLLLQGSWKGKSFRRFDVSARVPVANGGKKQPYRAFLDSVRSKFSSLGFQEMEGPLVETDFWNMDALFMPQFHSARDIHDAYYVKNPKYGTVDQSLIKKVKEMHEKGGSGSSGWNYSFDSERTLRHLLRTQGTACSSRMLNSKNLSIPGKYFGISRAFRYDVIDATHLPDFNQVEGIIVEENLTFRHLIGLLRMFAKEFANSEDIRLVPGYFPFTEPSVELYAKHPDLGWIELGGAGIFRPEVVYPLTGKNISVCAWGLGMDRLGMFKLGFKDIRNLFSHDLQFLRGAKVM